MFKRKQTPAQTVFVDWVGQRLVLTGHIMRRSEADAIGPVPASVVFWIGAEPDSTALLPISDQAMAVACQRTPASWAHHERCDCRVGW